MAGRYNRKDHLYERAKEEGFRSRAAYKLLELQKKYRILSKGSKCLDLGAWPGGWIQAARTVIGDNGRIVGIDLVDIEPFNEPAIMTIAGDMREEHSIAKALEFAGGKFDCVLSDLSPKLSGIKEVDQSLSVELAGSALAVAKTALRRGGNFVCKLFKGGDSERFVKEAKPLFNKAVCSELDSTRQTSNEYYFIGLGLK
ncbi:MAG: RlmE family RNA methyltransferase [Deltaproteobacteria bacterium]|nr:RlmE family RNA methyltransferase [Deltaproteobacteria bacterium]